MTKKIKIEYISLKKIVPYPKNPRKNDRAVEIVAKSIKEFGFKNPIVLDKKNEIVAGHTRLKAAMKLELKEVPVIWADDLTKEQVKAFRIMDNKSNEFAQWDEELLKGELISLQDADFRLDLTGFSFRELGNILEKEVTEDVVAVDAYERAKAKTKVKLGEIYKLGNHRLMCGDSTIKEDVGALMGENKAELLVTDPPYNYIQIKGAGIFKKQVMKVAKDIKNIATFVPEPFLEIIPDIFDKNMNAFIFCNKDLVPNYLNFALEKKYNFNILTWHKKTFIPLGGSHHYPDTEYCIFLSKKPTFNQGLSSEHYQKYWIENKDNIEYKEHPTAKPIKILSLQIRLCSSEEGVVSDLFGGSGSTLIACEQLNRKCFMMELDPVYVQVIIDRWEKFTNRKSQKVTENEEKEA